MHLETTLKSIASSWSLQGSAPRNLSESMAYSLLAGGKRIRARLCSEFSELAGLNQQIGSGLASVVELIHCFTLIHDDLPCMDDDDFRRGKPSNHKVYGEGVALLAGDALIAKSYELLGGLGLEPIVFSRLVPCLSLRMGAEGVIGGQAQEMLLNENSSYSDLEAVFHKKTASLFQLACELPALASNGGLNVEVASRFGSDMGIAFQIADDLDDDEELATRDPANVLFYLGKSEASEKAQKLLRRAAQTVDQLSQSRPELQKILHEVSERL